MIMRGIHFFTVLLALVLVGGPAEAHQLGVDRVFLQELSDHQYRITYNAAPGTLEAFSRPILPPHCHWDEAAETTASPADGLLFVSKERALTAGDSILLPWQRSGVVFTVRWRDGSQAQQFFLSGAEGILVELGQLQAGAGGLNAAAKRYTSLGIEHIWKGLDHLLFVAGLLMLVKGTRKLVLTITAFTLAHSLTLAMSVLGQVRTSLPVVDCIVCLSIVFLAVEILHALRGRDGLAQQKPWLVSFGFGLIHGLGFAGALNALGLARTDIPPALLFFNVGVELGQLGFVALWFAIAWAARQLAFALPPKWQPAPAYGLGIVATWWFLDRVIAMAA